MSSKEKHSLKARSVCSRSSRQSSKSAASGAALKARAKAEAALTRATYAQKEMEVRVKQGQVQAQLKVEETRLQATLNALHQQREAEAAAAEASVFEAAAEIGDIEQRSEGKERHSSHDSLQRIQKYVEDQHKYKEAQILMLAETTENKPLAPCWVDLLQPEPFVQRSPFQDLEAARETASNS